MRRDLLLDALWDIDMALGIAWGVVMLVYAVGQLG
jgi:hypothetical protein